MDNLKAIFTEEALDLIAQLERSLLALEQAENQKAIEQVFRVMHTLKGNCTMFGFDQMGELTHHLETIYDWIRKGKASLTQEVLSITLTVVDHLRKLLNDPEMTRKGLVARHKILTSQIEEISKRFERGTDADVERTQSIANEPVQAGISTYYLLFRPNPSILTNGTNVFYLLDELHQMGMCRIQAHTRHIPKLADLLVDTCYVHWDAYLATSQSLEAIREVFMFVEDECTLEIHRVSEGNLLANEQFVTRIDEQSHTEQEVDIVELQQYVNQLLQIIREQAITVAEYDGSQAEEELQTAGRRETATLPSIRVATEKVDELMNLVIELVTTQARLSLVAELHAHPELVAVAENIEKLTRRLRDSTFNMSLIPLETLLTRFQRLVRDLSMELGKEIQFLTEGAETELDKNMIESLSDPLLHILRNSIDHGIEDDATRARLGKPRQGTILLKAGYSGNSVVIQIQDDGAGLNPEKIRDKAVSKGLIQPDALLNEKELFDLIFLPGFSTASNVTEVSGRGVGMDVVRRNIAQIRGEVSLASTLHIGTTLTIKLPLTVSIIDGLLVKIAGLYLVIPLSVVEKCYEAAHSRFLNTFNKLIVLDGEQVPFLYLRDEFDITENCPALEQVVVVQYQGKRVGLTVDAIIGEYQAVLKPLGHLYKHLSIISGATILGDGTVALVMDTNQIIEQYAR